MSEQRFRFTKKRATEIKKAVRLLPWSEEASMFISHLELAMDTLEYKRKSKGDSRMRGRPLKEAERHFAAEVARLFESVLGKEAGIGRKGPYARVLSLCLHTSDPLTYTQHGADAVRVPGDFYLGHTLKNDG